MTDESSTEFLEDAIKQKRDALGITNREVAQAIGVAKSTLKGWIHGPYSPCEGNRRKVIKFLSQRSDQSSGRSIGGINPRPTQSGQALTKWRKQRGVSQKELAEETNLDISDGVISNFETRQDPAECSYLIPELERVTGLELGSLDDDAPFDDSGNDGGDVQGNTLDELKGDSGPPESDHQNTSEDRRDGTILVDRHIKRPDKVYGIEPHDDRVEVVMSNGERIEIHCGSDMVGAVTEALNNQVDSFEQCILCNYQLVQRGRDDYYCGNCDRKWKDWEVANRDRLDERGQPDDNDLWEGLGDYRTPEQSAAE